MNGNPLNILQSCFSQSWGGLEIQAFEVSRNLHRMGHTVHVAGSVGSRHIQEAANSGLRTVPYDVTGYFHPVIAWKLSQLIRREDIDIIHCQHSKDLATVVPAMKLSRKSVPIVLSKRVGSYISKKDIFHQFTFRHVSRVLAVSRVIAENIIQTTPIDHQRVSVLHDAVDTDFFSPENSDRNRMRGEFGMTEKNTVVGFAGRFTPGKGHEQLLEAAAILRRKNPDVRFLVVGEASHGEQFYEHSMRSMAHDKNLQDIVIFTGFRKDIRDVMSAFDILAFPSHAESFGMVLIEAMAMELPVVSTNCDGVLDIVVEGETGLYAHPRSGEELALALERFIRDPQLRTKMGKAGRRRVENNFSQKEQTKALDRIYRELLSSTR